MVFFLQELCSRDCTTIRIEIEDRKGRENTIVISSVYLPHDEEVPTIGMKKVIEYFRHKNLDLILGCDVNAYHKA